MNRRTINIYIIIIGVALASACSRTDIDGNAGTIRFTPVVAKATKAIITGTTYPTSESFMISAYYGGTATYFSDLAATYSSAIDYWTTSVSQYWPLAGSLTFHAFSPSDASGASLSSGGLSVTDYTIQNNTQMTTDLCYATATVADCASHPDYVPLTFSHALSQVVFRVKAADYYSTGSNTVSLTMTSLALGGIYSVADYSGGAWDNHESEHSYSLSSSSTALTYGAGNVPDTIDVCSFLFLPQELGPNASITVGYSITQTISGQADSFSNAPVTIHLGGTIDEWEPGKKYIYTLSIGMDNLITFTASALGWLEQEGGLVVE
ncbi:MAG: fimbrillin family protein [Bacteroidales bacterium]|nr:fimbrillin family protein [Bacteroidales bacterium]